MKATIITTMTSTIDLDTMETHHNIDINDVDGLTDVSPDVVGAILVSGFRAGERELRKQYPLVDGAAERADA